MKRIIAYAIEAQPHRRRSRVEPDGLPENQRFRDTGCEVSRKCLECPLPRCKHEDPTYQYREQDERDAQIAELSAQGMSTALLTKRFGVSPRTVHRAVARVRGGGRP